MASGWAATTRTSWAPLAMPRGGCALWLGMAVGHGGRAWRMCVAASKFKKVCMSSAWVGQLVKVVVCERPVCWCAVLARSSHAQHVGRPRRRLAGGMARLHTMDAAACAHTAHCCSREPSDALPPPHPPCMHRSMNRKYSTVSSTPTPTFTGDLFLPCGFKGAGAFAQQGGAACLACTCGGAACLMCTCRGRCLPGAHMQGVGGRVCKAPAVEALLSPHSACPTTDTGVNIMVTSAVSLKDSYRMTRTTVPYADSGVCAQFCE